MSRIRSIKPEFWSNAQVMECSRDARLLFIGLWNFADDFGRHPYIPRTIKALIFPGDEDAAVAAWLEELERAELITRYEVDGKPYLQITGWHHQKIDRPQAAKYPSAHGTFDKPSTKVREHVDDNSSNARRALATDEGKDEGKEGIYIDPSLRSGSSTPPQTAEPDVGESPAQKDLWKSPQPVDEQNKNKGEPAKGNHLTAKRKKPDDELILDLVDLWNTGASSLGLPQVTNITDTRQTALRARLKDFPIYGFDDPREGFRALMANIRGSPFLTGQTSANFRADFDFAVRQSSFTKIMEGSYASKTTEQRPVKAAY